MGEAASMDKVLGSIGPAPKAAGEPTGGGVDLPDEPGLTWAPCIEVDPHDGSAFSPKRHKHRRRGRHCFPVFSKPDASGRRYLVRKPGPRPKEEFDPSSNPNRSQEIPPPGGGASGSGPGPGAGSTAGGNPPGPIITPEECGDVLDDWEDFGTMIAGEEGKIGERERARATRKMIRLELEGGRVPRAKPGPSLFLMAAAYIGHCFLNTMPGEALKAKFAEEFEKTMATMDQTDGPPAGPGPARAPDPPESKGHPPVRVVENEPPGEKPAPAATSSAPDVDSEGNPT